MKSGDVKTEVRFVLDLLRDLKSGKLRVPKFQRPFVWSHEQIRQLLDSIVQGYPIGSLFVWETSDRYQNLSQVGPAEVDVEHPKEPAAVGYLLDGHQRLSTLMGSLMATDAQVKDWPDRAFAIYFDLETDLFVHTNNPKPHQFPVRKLIDTVSFLETCENLMKSEDSSKAIAWITKARGLVETFQKCVVAVTLVSNRDLNDAVEAFTRLNTEGKRMAPDQIFAALAYQDGDFDLADRIDRLSEDVLRPFRYAELNRTAILRIVLAALGEDIYSRAVDWRKIVQERRDELKQTLDSCEQNLSLSLAFLSERLGASSQKVLPYALQLVLLSEFYRHNSSPSDKAQKLMERWLWVTSFSGAFMVGSSARFNEAVAAARTLATTDRLDRIDLSHPALPLPLNFHAKAARIRAFFLFLKAQAPLHPESGEPIPNLLDDGFSDAALVFKSAEKSLRGQLANRVLLGTVAGSDPLSMFKSLKDKPDVFRLRVLDSHSISSAAWECLLADNVEGFLRIRRDNLIDDEMGFMKERDVNTPRHPRDAADWLSDSEEGI